jgi:hypothetical protein
MLLCQNTLLLLLLLLCSVTLLLRTLSPKRCRRCVAVHYVTLGKGVVRAE